MSESTVIDHIPWNCLPHTVLVSIYKYLEKQDQFNAGLVCRNWLAAFECATLWKDMVFCFGSDMVHDSRKAVQFMKKHAGAVKHLKLQFRMHPLTRHKEVMANMRILFMQLGKCSQLYTFELENFLLLQRTNPSHQLTITEMMRSFKVFLLSQKCLQKVTFFNLRLPQTDGLDIFSEMANKNASLQNLGLTYFFEETVTVFTNPCFQNSLRNLCNLKTLMLSYQCISSEILDMLCESKLTILEHLTVVCNSIENLHHTIPNEEWIKLRKIYPYIRISFQLVEVVILQQFTLLLPAASQVADVSYRCGFSVPTEENLRRHGVSILQYLSSTFADFLSQISLDFGFVGISRLERAILNLFRSCKKLTRATVIGVLPTTVAAKLCEIAMEEESALQDIVLVFYFTSIENIVEMRQLEDYRQQLKDKGVQFQFNLLSSQLFLNV